MGIFGNETVKMGILSLFVTLFGVGSFRSAAKDTSSLTILEQAKVHFEKSNYRTSLKLYKFAYSHKMNPLEALAGVVDSYEKLDKPNRSKIFLDEALVEAPFDIEFRLFAANRWEKYGDWKKAIKELDAGLKIAPKDPRPYLAKARIFHRLKNYNFAAAEYTNYIPFAKPEEFEPFLERAQSFYHLGQISAAQKDVKKAFEIQPHHTDILLTYSKVELALNSFNLAETMAKSCVSLNLNFSPCWAVRGDIAFNQKKYDQAVVFYQKTLERNPDDLDLNTKLAHSYLLKADFISADNTFSRVLKTWPSSLTALKLWIPSLISRKELANAHQVLQDFQSKNPSDVWSAVQYSQLLHSAGTMEAATETMENNFKSSKSDISRIFYAYFLFENADFKKAERLLLDVKDVNLPGTYNLGVLYWKMKSPTKALDVWKSIPSDSPQFSKTQVSISRLSNRIPSAEESNEYSTVHFEWEHPQL